MSCSLDVGSIFGEDVFSVKTMRNYLSEKAYNSLLGTIKEWQTIDPGIADEVADAMKTWAMEKGATHYTHWFQPLTGATAEKHDAFATPDGEGGVIMSFSGKELIKGEPDASSFPSGGLRATFEARGYTGWDPTSPAFIKRSVNGATLCIPSVFCGYHGEALDKKTPLLRSIKALSDQVCRLAELFQIEPKGSRAVATLGAEQEYFLIDRDYYRARPDLIETGRTLFGRAPAKHQQMEDHYFGSIKGRVMAFMNDLDCELWRLGVPAKTRHNEVCPSQFEIAPVFEEQNLSVDHNMITMEVLPAIAEQHGFACLLHEKPFARVNGSGKHNNWAVCGPDGKNWLSPGDNPHDNAVFLTMICVLVKAVDKYAPMLRAAVATAGNDHRLGANEAPPAILSVFLGDELTEIINSIESGPAKGATKESAKTVEIGISSLPSLPRDTTDRNRTSPFAFTGNKFEFRAVGSNQSCSGANVVLNTIVADVLDELCTKIDAEMKAGKDFNDALQVELSAMVKAHKRILFNGDNYTEDWVKEAEKRGLMNLKKTPEALKEMASDTAKALFSKHGVLTEKELDSRYEVYMESYEKTINIEAHCALTMAKTMILPPALDYQTELAINVKSLQDINADGSSAAGILEEVSTGISGLIKGIKGLEAVVESDDPLAQLDAMSSLREFADDLEGILPDSMWALPSYSELMFMS